MQLRFVASESAFDYFRATRTYLEAQGKPVAFSSGRFRVRPTSAVITYTRGRICLPRLCTGPP
jgi:hypothetical protein